MKKTLLLISFLASAILIQAQSLTPSAVLKSSIKKNKSGSGNSVMSIDTLSQYFDRATSYKIYSSTDGGYVYGPGAYDSSGVGTYPFVPISDATASHFDGVGNAIVSEILVWCAAKEIVGTADSIEARIYSVLSDSSANNILGSTTLSVNDLDTAGNFTSILINASITSSFLASLDYAGIDDTFGLVSSDPIAGDGAGEQRARQLTTPLFGSSWRSVDDLYGGQDADVIIIPIVNTTAGISTFNNNAFTLEKIYPSPATDVVNLNYTLKNNSNVSAKIFDMHGRILFSDKTANQLSGNYHRAIDVSSFANGKYYLMFNVGEKTLTQQFEVVK